MVLPGVISLPAAYRGIDWNTCILIGAMNPIAPAMAYSGVDLMIGGALVDIVGELSPSMA
jgi:di/tricarboxylate transporter